jgi:hypothetical protein
MHLLASMTRLLQDAAKWVNSVGRMCMTLPVAARSFPALATQIYQDRTISISQLSDFFSAILASRSPYHTHGLPPRHSVNIDRVVICAGPLKTGTTSLEAFLYDAGLACSPYGDGVNAFMANDIISIGNKISAHSHSFYQDLPVASTSFLEQLLRGFPSIENDAIFIYTYRDFASSAASLYAHMIRQRRFLGGSRRVFSTKLLFEKYLGRDICSSEDDPKLVTARLATFYRQHKERFDSLVEKHRLKCLYVKMDAVSNTEKAALVLEFLSPYVSGDTQLREGLFPIGNTKESPCI